MSKLTRRRLLGSAALLSLSGGALRASTIQGTPPGSPASGEGVPSFVEELRASLVARRGEIHSLRAVLDMEYVHDHAAAGDLDDELSVMEGQTELYYSSGKYRLVHHRKIGTVTEILDKTRYLQRLEPADSGEPPRILSEGPPDNRKRPKITLDSILPAPEDKPVSYLGLQSVDGRPAHVLLQSEYRFYIRADNHHVVRVDVFYTTQHVGMVVTFSAYRVFDDGVELPTEILVQELSEDGTVLREHLTTLREIQVNTELDPKLFLITEN